MSISNFGEAAFLNALFNNVAVQEADRFVKLHIGDPGEDCTANPAVETTRKAVTGAAAANWAADALPIGTGADTLAQTAFAANTFPARASTGNLVAKTITDAALSVLDDTTVAAMRATLGVPALTDGKSLTTQPAIANTETLVIRYTCAANELAAGTTFRFKAFGTKAGTNSSSAVIRIRVGTTTLLGNIAATLTPPANALAVPWEIEGLVTCITAGAGGTIRGSLVQRVHLAAVTIGDAIASTAAVAVNTTTANMLIELTFISGNAANTYTFQNVILEKVVA